MFRPLAVVKYQKEIKNNHNFKNQNLSQLWQAKESETGSRNLMSGSRDSSTKQLQNLERQHAWEDWKCPRSLNTGFSHWWKSSCPFQKAVQYLWHSRGKKANYCTAEKLLFPSTNTSKQSNFKGIFYRATLGKEGKYTFSWYCFRGSSLPLGVLLSPCRFPAGPPACYGNTNQSSWSHCFSLKGPKNLILVFPRVTQKQELYRLAKNQT